MEENKFEKQVQQKMDELQIQPSDAVWGKIELRIEKKKSRRWGLILLFLCVSILLSGGYWLWNAKQQKTLKNTDSAKNMSERNNNLSPIKENKIVQQQIDPASESTNKKNNDVAKDEEKEKAKQNPLLNNSKANQPFNFDDKSAITFSGKKKIKSKTDDKTKMEVLPAEALQNKIANGNIIKQAEDSIDKKINYDSSTRPVVLNAITKEKDTSSKEKEISVETAKHPNKNKWRIGILFVGGISGAGKDFLALNSPSANYSSDPLNSGGQSQPGFSSPRIKGGFGFISGLSVERNISKKIKFVSGINFKSFSTSIKLNDSAGTYRARAVTSKYINHFNFIEVPLSLRIQIGKGKNLPLSWQGGIFISELISSDALQLNSSTGYYYKNNSLFNKTQIGFNTAFLLTLFSKQKNSILIGPYFYYDASKIANEGLHEKEHFAFAGLHAAILFGN